MWHRLLYFMCCTLSHLSLELSHSSLLKKTALDMSEIRFQSFITLSPIIKSTDVYWTKDPHVFTVLGMTTDLSYQYWTDKVQIFFF